MKNILVLDTTTSMLKIGLSFDGRTAFVDSENRFKHIENIIPSVDSLFKEIDGDKSKLDSVCVCTGPGSFTGIRIGIATAQALAFAGRIKCFGINSFEVYQYLCGEENSLIVPVIDARKDRFYCSFLEGQQEIEMFDISKYQIVDKIEECCKRGCKKVFFAGMDAVKIEDLVKEKLTGLISYDFVYPRGFSSEDLLTYAGYHREHKPLGEPEPIYLRKSEAEIALIQQNR